MRTITTVLIISILLSLNLVSFSQDIATDTTLANKYIERAVFFKDSSHYDSAKVYFEKACELFEAYELWKKYVQGMIQIGVCYSEIGEYDKVINLMKDTENKAQKYVTQNEDLLIKIYDVLGYQYYYKYDGDSTILYWDKVLQLNRQLYGEKSPKVAQGYNNIGIVYYNIGQFDLALEFHKKALNIRKELFGEVHLDIAESYNNIGINYLELKELDLALEYFLKDLKITKELLGEKHLYVSSAYNHIALVYQDRSEFDLALKYLFKSLEIRIESFGEMHPYVARSYNNIGNVYNDINEYELALEYFNKSLQIEKQLYGEDHNTIAETYASIGSVYDNRNEFDLALEYFFKALQIKENILGEAHSDVAVIKNNIGLVYWKQKEYEIALKYLNESLQIRKEIYGEHHIYVATSYVNIAGVYYDKLQLDVSLDYQQKALSILLEVLGEENTYIAISYNNIGSIYHELREYERAHQFYLDALKIYKSLNLEKHSDIAMTFFNIGENYRKQNELSLALKYFQNGVEACIKGFDSNSNEDLLPLINEYLSWKWLLDNLVAKADIYANSTYEKKNFELALKHYQACDTLINQVRQSIATKSDKIALGVKANEIYNKAVQVCYQLIKSGDVSKIQLFKELAFYFSEKNKSSVLLEALAGAEAQKFAGIPDSLLTKEHQLRKDITLYKKLLAEPDSAQEVKLRDELFASNRKYDALIKRFETDYPNYFELKYNQKPASVKDIQSLLDNRTAMISYFTGDSLTTIFTITQNDLDIKVGATVNNLADTIKHFRYGLIYTSSPRFAKTYKDLAYKFYKKLIPGNLNPQIENLVIIPDAELSMIPFETLLTDEIENKEWNELPYLIKKYNISYSYSANLFYRTFPKNPEKKIETADLNDWLAFAPVFDDSNTAGLTLRTRELLQQFDSEMNDTLSTRGRLVDGGYISPLPGTESEVQSIFSEFDEKGKKALVQIKKSANEDFIKYGGLKGYKYLHFATHGFVNTEKPELSGIFLAQDSTLNEDGILYQGEIYNLDLNADLTVLSACETGLGKIKKGEGLIGLTRALLYAGSKNIIVSLWKVADDSTSDLMIDFYKNLLKEEQKDPVFSEALRKAKLDMINEGKYAHPFYWSPFILIGK